MIVTGYSENCWVLGGTGGYWVVLGILGVLLGTAGYWGVLEGYWVLEVLGVLSGSAGFCGSSGSSGFCEILLGISWVLGGTEG